MLSLNKIKNVSEHPLLIKFADFVIGHCKDNAFPILKEMDLLEIPGLVKYIWKIHYKPNDGGKLNIIFTGTEIDRFWKINPSTVGTIDELYSGKDYDDVIPDLYKKSLEEGKVAYSCRVATIDDNEGARNANIEAIFFPCSSDGEAIDSGIGFVDYYTKAQVDKNIFLLL